MKIEEFLEKSLTAFHATENCERILIENNFKKLVLGQEWSLKEGERYYITKNNSSIIAFVIGSLKDYFFNIAEAHTDSPALLVKGKNLIDSPIGYRINVEAYGKINYYSFLDIPLKIAGRAIFKEGQKLKTKLVQSDQNVVIPSLAIHQNEDLNEGLKLSVQNDLLPLAGNTKEIYSFFDTKDIIDLELFVVPDIKSYKAGINEEYFCSPRIDNLISVWCLVNAICKSNPKGISVACCFDNEEVKSLTKQGADSLFLTTVLKMIKESLSMPFNKFVRACEKGLILSIDNAHSIHPSYPEKSDIVEPVKLGEGVVIKHNTKYSTDAYASAQVKMMLNKNKIKYQDFYCNSDIECSTTLGPISSSLLHMNACDIGVAQLSMHSTVETVSYKDIESLAKCCKAFFEYKFDCEN